MGIMTVTMSTIRTPLDNSQFPLCSCGKPLMIYDHHKKRKRSEHVATVADCENPECNYSKEGGFISHNPEDLLDKVKKFLKEDT